MRLRQFIVLGFFALIGGALIGSIADDVDPNVRIAKQQAKIDHDETSCLREALYYEGRGGLVGEQIMQGMVILARVADPDPEWPKTICGVVHQIVHGRPQFSYWMDEKVLDRPIDPVAWGRANEIADYLRKKAWSWQLLPRGAACVRSFKVRDTKLAMLSEKGIEQLHVSARSLGFFSRTQKLVFTVGDTGFYQNKSGCDHPLPTM